LIDYDPFSPAVLRDPYPVYKRLRDEAPAFYLPKYDCWAISRFEDVWAISSDTARFTVTKGTASAQVVTREQPVTPMLHSTDPPTHSVLRAAVRPAFLPKQLREMEGRVRGLVAELLAPAFARGGCDVVGDVGSKLSTKVACLAIGLPLADGEYLHRLVQRFFTHDPSQQGISADGWAAMNELNDYCIDRVREERAAPAREGGALAALAAIEIGGARMPDAAAASHVSELIVGGSVTFPKVLASALVRLWEHPAQRAALARDPIGIADAFTEVVRYDMPTQFLCRTVTQPLTLHGQSLTAGQGVLMLYPSANRDEREFANPDVFDVTRRPLRIASFGAGQHACLGQHIAKLEGRLCLEAILARAPEYTVDLARAKRHDTEFVQGYERLSITF
jgi:cytochrome P450